MRDVTTSVFFNKRDHILDAFKMNALAEYATTHSYNKTAYMYTDARTHSLSLSHIHNRTVSG